ncbi:MAG: protein phosphatase 2C domain-containing protein [Clostridiales Family XIII bacterium]|jgi:serine/threonine protein phosphatase PrpC|nr:protein phosphatase 2C domain-containing protein [Clostridiales Family XIII bacterium]
MNETWPDYDDATRDDSLVTVRLDAFPERVRAGMSSAIGRRDYQQDAAMVGDDLAYADTNRMIAILCDGMGGLSGGEAASNLCATMLYEDFHARDVTENVNGFLKASVRKLDRAVTDLKDANQNPLKAGTTLACVVITGDDLYWASVGDSRIYLIRDDEIAQITTDHNYAMLLDQKVRQGILAREEADGHPKREALVSYIGMCGVRYIDANAKPFRLVGGDRVLICSDGLYRSLGEEEMKGIVVGAVGDMAGAADALIARAIGKQKRNQDNATVVVIEFLETVGDDP